MQDALTILGVESSCDDTGIAVVRGAVPGPGEILSNEVAGQAALHQGFGGVVPEIAARAHAERLDGVAPGRFGGGRGGAGRHRRNRRHRRAGPDRRGACPG